MSGRNAPRARYDEHLDAPWRNEALCADPTVEPEIFFPDGENDERMIQVAKAICWACDVREECLDYALKTNQKAGIWGGMETDERKKYRRNMLTRQRRRKSLND